MEATLTALSLGFSLQEEFSSNRSPRRPDNLPTEQPTTSSKSCTQKNTDRKSISPESSLHKLPDGIPEGVVPLDLTLSLSLSAPGTASPSHVQPHVPESPLVPSPLYIASSKGAPSGIALQSSRGLRSLAQTQLRCTLQMTPLSESGQEPHRAQSSASEQQSMGSVVRTRKLKRRREDNTCDSDRLIQSYTPLHVLTCTRTAVCGLPESQESTGQLQVNNLRLPGCTKWMRMQAAQHDWRSLPHSQTGPSCRDWIGETGSAREEPRSHWESFCPPESERSLPEARLLSSGNQQGWVGESHGYGGEQVAAEGWGEKGEEEEVTGPRRENSEAAQHRVHTPGGDWGMYNRDSGALSAGLSVPTPSTGCQKDRQACMVQNPAGMTQAAGMPLDSGKHGFSPVPAPRTVLTAAVEHKHKGALQSVASTKVNEVMPSLLAQQKDILDGMLQNLRLIQRKFLCGHECR